jgi:hypothetical protein
MSLAGKYKVTKKNCICKVLASLPNSKRHWQQLSLFSKNNKKTKCHSRENRPSKTDCFDAFLFLYYLFLNLIIYYMIYKINY